MFINNYFNLALIFLISVLVGCSDDSNPTKIEDEEKMPQQPTVKEIVIPEALKTKENPYAQMAVGYIALSKGFSGFSTFFAPPSGSNNLDKLMYEEVYTWDYGNLTVTMNYYEDLEAKWDIYLNGIDGPYTYLNWLYIAGEQLVDGSSGKVTIYKKVTTDIAAVWEWSTDENGTYNLEMIYNDYHDKVILVDNNDLSGMVSHFEFSNGVYYLIEKIQYYTDSSGEYWVYDLEGNIETHGTWD